MATRFDTNGGVMKYDDIVITRLSNDPLIPNELWSDNRLTFVNELKDKDNDLSAVPDDLRAEIQFHGYWP